MINSIHIDPLIKVRDPSHLLPVAKVVRVTDFDEEAVQTFAKEMSLAHQTGQPVIPIVIDSFGGDIYSLWAMVEIIKASTVPVATLVEGKAMSCGAALFTCGTNGYRYIGPHSTLMIHDVASMSGGGKTEDIKVDVAETERQNRMLYAFMEANIGQPKGYLSKLSQRRPMTDWYITPREAVKYRLANKIGTPSLLTHVRVSMTFG